jgi:flagellar protein FlaG
MQNIASVARPWMAEVPAAPAAAPAGSNAAAAAAPAQAAAEPSAAAAPTMAQLKAAIAAANQELDQSSRELTFVFDDNLNRMLVKIVDTRTNTVIRQVPSEEMLAAARALSGTPARGALIKSKA